MILTYTSGTSTSTSTSPCTLHTHTYTPPPACQHVPCQEHLLQLGRSSVAANVVVATVLLQDRRQSLEEERGVGYVSVL